MVVVVNEWRTQQIVQVRICTVATPTPYQVQKLRSGLG